MARALDRGRVNALLRRIDRRRSARSRRPQTVERGSAAPIAVERGWLRAGHPDLAAGRRQPLEQGGAAERVEMGGDLVEEQDRAAPGLRSATRSAWARIEADEQRLLLAGRAGGGGLVLAGMGDERGRRGAGRPASRPAAASRARRARARSPGSPPSSAIRRAGEGAFGRGGKPLGQRRDGGGAGVGDGARHARPSAPPARRARPRPRAPSSASSLLRARIAAS